MSPEDTFAKQKDKPSRREGFAKAASSPKETKQTVDRAEALHLAEANGADGVVSAKHCGWASPLWFPEFRAATIIRRITSGEEPK